MKRLISLTLIFLLLISCITGCKKSDTAGITELTEADMTSICNTALSVLQNNISLPDSAKDDLVPNQVRRYKDEDVVHYTQNWNGVEIFGSSVVVATGNADLCIGTYYDLSNAFGNDFNEQVEFANTIPDWLVDQSLGDQSIRFHRDTLRAVIYILPDQTAVIARRIEATFATATESTEYTLVFSINGDKIYTCQTYNSDYSSADITGSDGNNFEVVKDGSEYYAYNQEFNFYVFNGNEDKAEDYITADGAIVNLDVIYSSPQADWSSGKMQNVYSAMSTYADVAAWYRDTLGYRGIDGNNGAAMLVLSNDITPGVATNAGRYGYLTYLFTTPHGYTAADAPEILAHEYGHAVIKNISGTNGFGQTGAVCEAICDCFGAAYIKNWHLAASLAIDNTDKNIAANKMTMDDYIYDTLDQYGDVLENNIDNPVYSFFYDLYEHTAYFGFIGIFDDYITMNTDQYSDFHTNAYIISHTLYQIWKNVLNENYDVFANILYNSIRYLPTNANFSNFRTAFLHSMSKVYDDTTVAEAVNCFDRAGIVGSKTVELVNAGTSKDTSTFYYAQIYNMTYEEISAMDWDESYFFDSFDNPGMWYFNGYQGNTTVFICFEGEMETVTDKPESVSVYDNTLGSEKSLILPGVETGMYYEDIKSVLPGISDLIASDTDMYYTSAEYSLPNGLTVYFTFADDMGMPLLTSAVIS